MNENEIMVNEEPNDALATDRPIEERTQMSTATAMLIGSGLTLAVIVGVKKGKKLLAKIRAKKEASKKENDSDVIDIEEDDVRDITDAE